MGSTVPASAANSPASMVAPVLLAQAGPEDIFWQSVQNSDDPAMFEAYLEQVRKGVFVGTYKPLAEIKLNALRKAAPVTATPVPETSTPATPAGSIESQSPVTSSPEAGAQPVATQPMSGDLAAAVSACDRAAANAHDPQKAPDQPGVEFDRLIPGPAISACRTAADMQGAPARVYYQLGRAYDKAGNTKDAMLSYAEASNAGHAMAAYNIGTMMAQGKGMKRDQKKALAMFEQAGAAGVPTALWQIGNAYLNGRGTRRDYAKAMDYFQRAIDAGEPQAYNDLGYMYDHGFGAPKDRGKACELWQEAARLGDSTAINNSRKFCR